MPPRHQSKPKKINKNGPFEAFSLNPAQRSAAEAPISPLLIVAGAGTGKTRTLTSRIAHLIATGTAPERICAITFTNKAAEEMRSRVAAMGTGTVRGIKPSKIIGQGPMIGTFHSLGARILRSECRAFGRTPNFAIFDDHDSFDLLKKISKGLKEKPAFFAQKISVFKNKEGAANDLHGSPEERSRILSVYQKYEEALGRNNAFDFDDLIQKPVALFKKDPAVLRKYQKKFDAILVDEYQDINPQQYELVKLFAREHRNLSVVGDDEQTIYSWRYADIRTFLDFEKHWPGSKVYFLEENYRSTGNIIRAAAAVAEHNRYRTPKKLWTGKNDGAPIMLFEAWGENEEGEWIAGEIEKILADAGRGSAHHTEIAVLYRTNAQSRAIEQALIRRDIPYEIFGGLKFYERREVKDAVAALRWASNKKDEVAKERLEKNLSKRKFAAFKEKIAAAEGPKPLDVVKLFLETFGYFEYLEGNFTNAAEREENIGELVTFASGFQDLQEFLEKISLLQATDDILKHERGKTKAAHSNRVLLMTVHMAKGLEFENVFIAGVAEGLLPHIRSISNEETLEEERRLMYVAMTRAKEKLYISFYGMPSRFLAEIPDEHIALANGMDDDAGMDNDAETDDGNDFEENVVNF
jgi:DNA helicase II / ATP-dependent DNA helicase PcrA